MSHASQFPRIRQLLFVSSLFAISSACSGGDHAHVARGNAAQIDRDKMLASILTCGGGVFEDQTPDPVAKYDYSLRDGAELLVSVGHRVGFARVSRLLGLGDDGGWMESQFEPDSYQLKEKANKTVKSSAYLLGQYARQYCIEHPFDTLNDAIENAVKQIEARK